MPSERTYYVICEDNCKFEGMTKEQIIAAIAEATGTTPTQIDDAFITKIKEMNANASLKFWVGTTAQFNALETKAADTLYIFTDDDTEESLEADIESLRTTVTSYGANITAMQDGSTPVGILKGKDVYKWSTGEQAVTSVEITEAGTYLVAFVNSGTPNHNNCLSSIITIPSLSAGGKVDGTPNVSINWFDENPNNRLRIQEYYHVFFYQGSIYCTKMHRASTSGESMAITSVKKIVEF